MDRVAIRFTNDLYVHMTYDNGDITLYTVDKENKKTEYNVSKKSSTKTGKTNNK